MQSIDLIRDNLKKSSDRVLLKIDEMSEHGLLFPTPRGGAHSLWVLGHLAYIEGLVISQFMQSNANPLAKWESIFDGKDITSREADYPPFSTVLQACREMRGTTLGLLEGFNEEDLDKLSSSCPDGHGDTFGTYRLCFQFVADHWYMHRGQLADARRAAGVDRMWF